MFDINSLVLCNNFINIIYMY